MKGLWIVLGAGAFLLPIVTPLYAQMDIKTTGQIRVRYRDWQEFLMDDNLPVAQQGGPGRDRHYFDVRIRFGVTAKLEPGLTGTIELERWDDFGTHSVVNANVPNSNASLTTGVVTDPTLGIPGNTDALYFRQAWVDWVIPGTPIHIAGGRMLPTYGGSITLDASAYGMDGIQTYGQWGPLTVSAFYWKAQIDGGVNSAGGVVTPNRRFADNDFDIYGGNIKYWLLPKNSIELYGFLSNDKTRAKNQSIANTPGICTGAPGNCADTSEWFVGLAASGVQGPFTYRLEGAYQGGIARQNVAATAALGNPAGDIDRSAWFIAGGASWALIPELALKLDGGYASGDDNAADNEFNNFASIYGVFAPTLLFQLPIGTGNTSAAQFGQNTTNRAIFGTTFGTSDLDLNTTTNDAGQRFSPGMLYFKPGVRWVPFKQLTINGEVAVLWAAESPGVDSYIGTEADLQISWQVYKNLVVNGYFGYLFAGDYFDRTGVVAPNVANVDNPWFGTVEFILTF